VSVLALLIGFLIGYLAMLGIIVLCFTLVDRRNQRRWPFNDA